MEVRMHDVGRGWVRRRLPYTYAVAWKFPVDAVNRAFNGLDDAIDGGFVHVANIRVVVSRCQEQVAVMVFAKIQQGDGMRILGDDTCNGFAGCDRTKDTSCVHG